MHEFCEVSLLLPRVSGYFSTLSFNLSSCHLLTKTMLIYSSLWRLSLFILLMDKENFFNLSYTSLLCILFYMQITKVALSVSIFPAFKCNIQDV